MWYFYRMKRVAFSFIYLLSISMIYKAWCFVRISISSFSFSLLCSLRFICSENTQCNICSRILSGYFLHLSIFILMVERTLCNTCQLKVCPFLWSSLHPAPVCCGHNKSWTLCCNMEKVKCHLSSWGLHGIVWGPLVGLELDQIIYPVYFLLKIRGWYLNHFLLSWVFMSYANFLTLYPES